MVDVRVENSFEDKKENKKAKPERMTELSESRTVGVSFFFNNNDNYYHHASVPYSSRFPP